MREGGDPSFVLVGVTYEVGMTDLLTSPFPFVFASSLGTSERATFRFTSYSTRSLSFHEPGVI
jgi:hypothetical protein